MAHMCIDKYLIKKPLVHWVHCQTLSKLAYMSAVCVQYLHELYGAGEQHLPVHLLAVHVVQPDHDLDHLVQIDCASSVFVKHFEKPICENIFYVIDIGVLCPVDLSSLHKLNS